MWSIGFLGVVRLVGVGSRCLVDFEWLGVR